MRVKRLLVLLILFGFFTPAEAQQSKKVPRIGLLLTSAPSGYARRIDAFRQGLRDLGYVEGTNIVIEYRYAEGKLAGLNELAAELVRLFKGRRDRHEWSISNPCRQGSNSYDSYCHGV
jgi:putative ABC transport system substrate-binding protein